MANMSFGLHFSFVPGTEEIRYLLDVHSYGCFCVKVKRLDHLDILLFLLTLTMRIK